LERCIPRVAEHALPLGMFTVARAGGHL